MTPCARHHLAHGQHAPGCTCTPECPDHEGHCTGCLPVEATNGLLCRRCAQRLEDFLGASEGLAEPGEEPIHGLPWAYDHLANAYPSLTQAPGGGGSSIEDAEAQRVAAVVSLRADMHDRLEAWVDLMAEHLNRSGPDFSRRAGLFGQRLRTIHRARWLLAQAAALEAHEAVAEAWQELADLMSRAHALAPWRPAPTRLDGSLCRCGAVGALHDYGTEVVCTHCRRNYSREEYRVMSTVFGRRYADDPRGQAAIATPVLPKLPVPTRVAEMKDTLARITEELDALKAAGVNTEADLRRWSELVAMAERIRATLEPIVSGHGGRP